MRHTEVSGQQAKEEVSQLVRGLGAVLEEKRASLLQAIEECQQERLARLSAQIQEHRSLLDGSGLVGYAQEVLKETDQPCFVQAAKQLHNRIARATEALQAFRPAASSSFRHCQLDVGREMKLLTELSFLRGCGHRGLCSGAAQCLRRLSLTPSAPLLTTRSSCVGDCPPTPHLPGTTLWSFGAQMCLPSQAQRAGNDGRR